MKGECLAGWQSAWNNHVGIPSPAGMYSDVMMGVRSMKTACLVKRHRGYFNIRGTMNERLCCLDGAKPTDEPVEVLSLKFIAHFI